jgi:small subunit ribosomal protein S20
MRKVEEANATGTATAARTAWLAAEPEIARGVSKGVVKRNTASRKISRLAHRVNALG